MATIVYLDVDDEITSAAARIRAAGQSRVALVLPYGSRLATSRINFRLLAREAILHGRRLGIVAPDASTRALAASAGLPVFHSVTEYETSLDAPRNDAADTSATSAGSDGGDDPGRAAARAATGLRGGTGPRGVRRPDPDDDDTATMIIPVAATATAGTATTATDARPGAGVAGAPVTSRDRDRPRADADATARTVATAIAADPMRPPRPGSADARPPAARARSGPGVGALVGLGVLALAVVVAGVAGYVFLPSATVEIVPRVEPIGPLAFEIRADPEATEVDAANGVIPAQRIELPVSTTGDFPATGKRVDADKATGTVRFDSINTVGPVFVPAGTRISTLSAVVFQTVRGVTVPRAQVNGTTIQHGIADVNIRAVKEGPDGNVDEGEITQVPDNLGALQVSVRNNAPTKGGKIEEFPRVEQADVDAAVAQLTADLQTQFQTALASPPGLPERATLLPATATLGEPELLVDPQSFVGQELEAFTLEASATGSVLAVDEAPLASLVEDRLRGMVAEGSSLVDGSMDVRVGSAVVTGGTVVFPVSGVAQQSAQVDVAAVEAAIRGKPRAEAAGILGTFGAATLSLWPEWVSSVPTLDQRVDVLVGTSEVPEVTAPPLPTPPPTPEPSAAPSASPSTLPSAAPS